MSHLLHALPLLDANSYPWSFVSYGTTHVPTREISGYLMGVAKMREEVPYTPATNGRIVLDEDKRRGI